ncbi:hypothetical protein AAC387_Pa08g1325 [Persea americana]
METSRGNPDPYRSSSIGGGSRSHELQFSLNFFQSPFSAILEYSGILRTRPSHQENKGLIDRRIGGVAHEHALSRGENSSVSGSGGGEVSIRIIGAAEQEHLRSGLAMGQVREVDSNESGVSESQIGGPVGHSSNRYALGGAMGQLGRGLRHCRRLHWHQKRICRVGIHMGRRGMARVITGIHGTVVEPDL